MGWLKNLSIGPGRGASGRADKNNGVWTRRIDAHPNANYLSEQYREAGRSALKTFRPALLRCATLFARSVQMAAMTKGSTTETWEPLTDRYEEQKRRKVGSKAAGYFSGKLMAELTNTNSGIKHLDDKVLEYGSDSGLKAIVYNFGGNFSRTVPSHQVNRGGTSFTRRGYTTRAYKYGRRATLWFNRNLVSECSREISDYSINQLREAGLPIDEKVKTG